MLECTDGEINLNSFVAAVNASITTRTKEVQVADGVATVFTLTELYEVGKESLVDIFVGGALYDEVDDYTLSGGDTLTFTTAPSDLTKIVIKILK